MTRRFLHGLKSLVGFTCKVNTLFTSVTTFFVKVKARFLVLKAIQIETLLASENFEPLPQPGSENHLHPMFSAAEKHICEWLAENFTSVLYIILRFPRIALPLNSSKSSCGEAFFAIRLQLIEL